MECTQSRQRLDPPNPCGTAHFGGDLENPDLAGARDVRAAAEFGTVVIDADDPHAVQVLFAEQRHRAAANRFVQVLDFGDHGRVAQDSLIHEVLDLLDLGRLDRGVVRDIEAESIRVDDAPGLLGVGSENLAQGRVQ